MQSPFSRWTLAHMGSVTTLMLGIAGPMEIEAATISLNIQLSRQNDASYAAFPALGSSGPLDLSAPVEVRSGNGSHYGRLNSYTGTTEFFSTFDELKTQASISPWTLTFDPEGASPEVYSFNVDVTNLGTIDHPAELPAVQYQGTTWSGDTGLSPTFSWSGPAGFDGLSVDLYRSTGLQWLQSASLPTDTTSWSPGISLEPVTDYLINVRYFRTETTGTAVIGMPNNGTSDLPFDWAPQVSLETSIWQTVTSGPSVPEPSWSVLAGALGLCGFAWLRKARA